MLPETLTDKPRVPPAASLRFAFYSLLRVFSLRSDVRHLVCSPSDVTENYHTSPVARGLRDINTPGRLFFAEYVRDFLSALCACCRHKHERSGGS